jgi:hypothetical protein
MGCAPFALKLLNFGVGESLRLKFPPGVKTAHIAEGEIAGFAGLSLW